MTTLILPVAGGSSRFPGMRPKWLLTMPCGSLMFEKSISKLNLELFDRIVIVCLRDHIAEYVDLQKIKTRLQAETAIPIDWVVLDQATSCQAETIVRGIEYASISGSIFIKDCDNEFTVESDGINEIAVMDLNEVELVDAKNKSYVQINDINNVIHIIEKKVISNLFCCGGYGFESAEKFVSTFNEITPVSGKEVYISHVIYQMLINGETFKASLAKDYLDWGTSKEYFDYTQEHITVFCDIDGVLLKNGSAFGHIGWDTDPLIENVTALKKLQEKGRLFLILTTSRPLSQKEETLKKLEKLGLYPNESIFGLPHSKRILINDYSETNPYPSALSINLERDSLKLQSLFSAFKP